MEDGFSILPTSQQSKRLFSTVFPMEPREKEEREKKIKTNLKRKKSALLNRHITSLKLEKALKRLPKSED